MTTKTPVPEFSTLHLLKLALLELNVEKRRCMATSEPYEPLFIGDHDIITLISHHIVEAGRQEHAKNGAPKPYTVVLLRPDYIADGDYDADTYTAHVEAVSVYEAIGAAQKDVFAADQAAGLDPDSPYDYALCDIFEGHHDSAYGR